MRYGISVWNFCEESIGLPDLIGEFADMGYDTMSFLPQQITGLKDDEARALRGVLDDRNLSATVHGKSSDSSDTVAAVIDLLQSRLLSLTFDAAMSPSSVGSLYDIKAMSTLLESVEQLSRGTRLQFGIEDFPLDARAFDFYKDDLGSVLTCERFGMLVDIGHLNLRRKGQDYFKDRTEQSYVEGAPLQIVEVHVHDNSGDKDSHGHIGFGNIDFDAVAEGLNAVGFDGISTIEICSAFHGSTPAKAKPRAAESLKLWRETMRRAKNATSAES